VKVAQAEKLSTPRGLLAAQAALAAIAPARAARAAVLACLAAPPLLATRVSVGETTCVHATAAAVAAPAPAAAAVAAALAGAAVAAVAMAEPGADAAITLHGHNTQLVPCALGCFPMEWDVDVRSTLLLSERRPCAMSSRQPCCGRTLDNGGSSVPIGASDREPSKAKHPVAGKWQMNQGGYFGGWVCGWGCAS
jgi:hypothetical protein